MVSGWQQRRAEWMTAALIALAALSRVAWEGRSLGEADGARYLMGLEQWLRFGPSACCIYAKTISPGYYALAAAWIRHFHAAPRAVLDGISLAAALLSAPLLFLVGRRLVSEPAAGAGAAIFLLAPGFWWLGLEPHPQGAACLFLLGALAAFSRRWPGHALAAAILLTFALLLKFDTVLLAAAFPALAWSSGPALGRWHRAAGGACVPAAALLAALGLRNPLLGMGWRESRHLTGSAVGEFLQWPHGVAWLKQTLPLLTALGPAVCVLVAAGLGLGFLHRGWRQRWLLLLSAWALPGGLFWLAMRGNNVRHVVVLCLLPLWAALEAWMGALPHRGGRAALAALALAALLADAWLPPPSSNLTLYPSGNVPASVADVRARTAELDTWLSASLRTPPTGPAASCFFGGATLPYLELALLAASPGARLRPLPGAAPGEALEVDQPGQPPVRFLEANDPAQARWAQSRCRRQFGAAAASLDFTPTAVHAQFFGREWHSLPGMRRWYPAGDALASPPLSRRGAVLH